MKPRTLILPVLSLLAVLTAAAVSACSGDSVQSAYLQANEARLDQPASGEAQPRPFVVQPGQTARGIAENLAGVGLITDALPFEAYVRVNGLAEESAGRLVHAQPEHDDPGHRGCAATGVWTRDRGARR